MKYEQFLADVVQSLAEVDFMGRMLSRVKSVLSATHDLVEKNGRLEKENAELRDELDDWKGNAEGFQPDSYMKLPLDADGIAISPGDKIYFSGDPEGFALKCIAVGLPPCPVEFVDWEETGTTAWEEGSAFTHRQPTSESVDSWAKLEEDIKKRPCSYFDIDQDTASCDDCPHGSSRIGTVCWLNALDDMIARAKKLAGVEEEEQR